VSEDPSSLCELRRGTQKTEDRGQKTEDRRQRTEDPSSLCELRRGMQRTEDRILEVGGRNAAFDELRRDKGVKRRGKTPILVLSYLIKI